MPAVAKKQQTSPASTETTRVIALTHAFYDMRRYRRGDEVEIQIAEGQPMPAWCILADDAPRERDGRIKLADLPLFVPANARL